MYDGTIETVCVCVRIFFLLWTFFSFSLCILYNFFSLFFIFVFNIKNTSESNTKYSSGISNTMNVKKKEKRCCCCHRCRYRRHRRRRRRITINKVFIILWFGDIHYLMFVTLCSFILPCAFIILRLHLFFSFSFLTRFLFVPVCYSTVVSLIIIVFFFFYAPRTHRDFLFSSK